MDKRRDSPRILRDRVGYFVSRKAKYKTPLLEFFLHIKRTEWRAAIFGGTLRDLTIKGSAERPRDIDVVVDVPDIEMLVEEFTPFIRKRTRFGGLRLNYGSWPIDIWPLHSTWAFSRSKEFTASFDSLPQTTFLNVEAIAIDLWPRAGAKRQIFESYFFESIASQTLEINYADNPYPELCVVRSLIAAAKLDWRIGPKLLRYISSHGTNISISRLTELQLSHYGEVKVPSQRLRFWIDQISSTGEGGAFGSGLHQKPKHRTGQALY